MRAVADHPYAEMIGGNGKAAAQPMSAGGPDPARPDSSAPSFPSPGEKIGSLDVFWELVEPILTHLRPRMVCEIGVENGSFTAQLLTWGRANRCGYTGIDPVIDPALEAQFRLTDPTEKMLVGRSLNVLPTLDLCGVYFVDGDHNYHTVRHELAAIQRAAVDRAGDPAGPVIFLHDVGWPWGRRDMYYQPSTVPDDARHPGSARLGVHLGGDELIDGGLRDPDSYHIALHSGGPRNGVLTAVEDFLASDEGRGWEMILIPAAYGLAILYRPDDKSLPAPCRDHLRNLRSSIERTGSFLRAYEANYLTLYLYCEYARDDARHQLTRERGAHHQTLQAYQTLDKVYQSTLTHSNAVADAYRGLQSGYAGLQSGYAGLQSSYTGLQGEYNALQGVYGALQTEYQRLLDHNASLQKVCDDFIAISRDLLPDPGASPGE